MLEYLYGKMFGSKVALLSIDSSYFRARPFPL